jgi:hypothetical protein
MPRRWQRKLLRVIRCPFAHADADPERVRHAMTELVRLACEDIELPLRD